MKKIIFAIIITAVLLTGCRSAPAGNTSTSTSTSTGADFSGVIGKEWKLTEVWLDGKNTGFDRHALTRGGFPADIFTLNVNEEFFSGAGAPNRYSAPYTRDNYAITISQVRATLMAALRDPDKLREHDFFVYLQNISAWSLSGHKLTFTSKNMDGAEVRLVFTP
jgi:heat shock protein HslJ